jgi:hypothetical protein
VGPSLGTAVAGLRNIAVTGKLVGKSVIGDSVKGFKVGSLLGIADVG